jgi:DNA-binding transcriptional ArsR family regulator
MPALKPREKRHKELGPEQLQAVAALFAVLSEPSRLRILQVLQAGEAGVGDLVERCGFKQANMSKQLGILAAAGVIGRRQEGNRVIYRIEMPLIFELCHLVCGRIAEQAAARARSLRHNWPRSDEPSAIARPRDRSAKSTD